MLSLPRSKTRKLAPLLATQLALLAKHQLRTNDIVEISLSRRLVRVNTVRLRGLRTHDIAVLLVLAYSAKTGIPLNAKEVVERVDSLPSGFRWTEPHPEQIYPAVSRLRAALAAERLNVDLIETMSGVGYRLSTPYTNVILRESQWKKSARNSRKPRSVQDPERKVLTSDSPEAPVASCTPLAT
jgi:DNA-binding winged helix-turn-helix (wHTH) protein